MNFSYVECDLRGDSTVIFTYTINSISDEYFEAFLEECENQGMIDRYEVNTKSAFISSLYNFGQEEIEEFQMIL